MKLIMLCKARNFIFRRLTEYRAFVGNLMNSNIWILTRITL